MTPVVVLAGVALAAAALFLLTRAARSHAAPPPAPPASASPATPARAADLAARLDAFWAWWPTAAARFDAAIQAGQSSRIVEELSQRVHAIDPLLAWETGKGQRGARHHLALSAEGDGLLRVVTERWVARAPPADQAWEFYSARQRSPDWRSILELTDAPGVRLDGEGARVTFEVDDVRDLVHVTYHHPALAKLSEAQQARAAFLVLDDLLGEDGVERWIGKLDFSVKPPPEGRTLLALRDAVDALARDHREDRFTLLQGKTKKGLPAVATAALSLKRLDHLLLDHHLEITFRLRHPNEQGLTTSDEGAELNALEDELLDDLGRDAVYVGHETLEGRRVIHLHAAVPGPAMARVEAWARRHPDRPPDVAVRLDPQWEVLRRW